MRCLDVYPKKARVSGSKRRVNKTIAGRQRTLLLNVKPARMSVKRLSSSAARKERDDLQKQIQLGKRFQRAIAEERTSLRRWEE